MKLKWISFLSVVAMLVLLAPSALHADVHDNANIFSQSAVENANNAMKKMERVHNKQFVVETFAAVPDDQKAAEAQDSAEFFKQWEIARAKELKVNGVYAMICLDPRRLEVITGKNTYERGDFTDTDKDNLISQMKGDLHDKNYDKALSDGIDVVERAYTANISGNGRSTVNGESEYSRSRNQGVSNVPQFPGTSTGTGMSIGSLICLAVGAVIIFSLIKSVFRGTNSGGYGGGNFGGGNYPPTNQGYGQGYGQNYGGGFGGGGGGGGFGRGFLGGLLGGALGGYAADRFDHRDDQSNAGFPQSGGGFGDSSGGGGGSFDSGPSDAGQTFGGSAGGADFGSSGGGDSGGGGGGSGGSDF